MQHLIPYTRDQLNTILGQRPGETRLGHHLLLSEAQNLSDTLQLAKDKGARFVLLGAGEDAGPRANLGRGGATNAFEACMKWLVNLQSNRFYRGDDLLVLGQLDFHDLLPGDGAALDELRQAVASMDERVTAVASAIMDAGLEPIVIGGGHNNAFGLLMAVKQAFHRPAAAVNLDPHSDFRLREGRHSGNGFSYAAASGALDFYHVLGLHELKNSEANLEQLEAFGGSWHTLQQIWVRGEISLDDALRQISKALKATDLPVALELDVDAIANMPSSAMTAAGVPLMDAARYISHMAKHCDCAYLHLAEAAPVCHDAGIDAGMRETGQSLTELVYAYIRGRRLASGG
ncbi:formimidoylglutamase [Shewanella sp. JM162201]|uniref:Formimidoylglutamase n=1 Tax=Shewanella jiangmenensis TaxID=2837387 RepID=A0ABS5V967_9GAMM|nr:formimidoylglutamase [Shewanella jiangmenensis]MBT1446417.1 formimidoylglutamase [Shewanella jiangmenensis]